MLAASVSEREEQWNSASSSESEGCQFEFQWSTWQGYDSHLATRLPVTPYRGKYKIWIMAAQGRDQAQRYKDCPNCQIPATTRVGGEENLWFIDALKCSISGLILPEKTLKVLKTVFFKIYVSICIS